MDHFFSQIGSRYGPKLRVRVLAKIPGPCSLQKGVLLKSWGTESKCSFFLFLNKFCSSLSSGLIKEIVLSSLVDADALNKLGLSC